MGRKSRDGLTRFFYMQGSLRAVPGRSEVLSRNDYIEKREQEIYAKW